MIPLLAQATPKLAPLSDVFGLIFMGNLLFVFLYFRFSRNTTFKRKSWPMFVTVILSSFVLASIVNMATTGNWRWSFIGFQILMAALIGYFMIRRTHFCDSCGRTCYQHPFSSQPGFCPRCGAKLQ
jgi:hypothetical protein